MSAAVPGVDDVLTLGDLAADGLGPLTSPVLVVALAGWFDAAGVATTALDHLTEAAVTVGEIDPDPFYDFTQERPTDRDRRRGRAGDHVADEHVPRRAHRRCP